MAGEPTLRRGSRGADVERLQELLAKAGFDPGPADGVFGAGTEQAVRAFQKARDLVADGIVGPRTWVALSEAGGGGGGGQPGKRGVSIHIGLNAIDPDHYGNDGALAGCEFDANDMAELARSKGFDVRPPLLTNAATSQAVTGAIREAAATLGAGDILFLTYSGHGGQIPDGDAEEEDREDETWCLYDRQLIDDELYALWGEFQPGVRIAVLSDSCHSGSSVRNIVARVLDREFTHGAYNANHAMYNEIRKSIPDKARGMVTSSVLLISGCQDDQLSADGDRNGLFTATLLKVWDEGRFQGSYRDLHQAIVARMPDDQTPNFFRVGAANDQFERQTPFTI